MVSELDHVSQSTLQGRDRQLARSTAAKQDRDRGTRWTGSTKDQGLRRFRYHRDLLPRLLRIEGECLVSTSRPAGHLGWPPRPLAMRMSGLSAGRGVMTPSQGHGTRAWACRARTSSSFWVRGTGPNIGMRSAQAAGPPEGSGRPDFALHPPNRISPGRGRSGGRSHQGRVQGGRGDSLHGVRLMTGPPRPLGLRTGRIEMPCSPESSPRRRE